MNNERPLFLRVFHRRADATRLWRVISQDNDQRVELTSDHLTRIKRADFDRDWVEVADPATDVPQPRADDQNSTQR